METKKELRDRLKPLAKQKYQKSNRNIDQAILELSGRANRIIAYCSDVYEYRIDHLLSDKEVYYPKILENSLLEFVLPTAWEEKRFGIPSPVGKKTILPQEADLVFIPALGFNRTFHRLGRGYGHFDKTIDSSYYKNFVGVCYTQFIIDFQHKPHDIRVEKLLTETGIIE
jgi:5-formyltetrahydrofolate cyclo-ligase